MSQFADRNFTTTLAREMWGLMCGKKLGSGVSRRVYEFPLNEQYVVKIEANAGSFQNVAEWETWQFAQFHDKGSMSKWLAPCISISACGCILIQRRTTLIRKAELPARVPGYFTDLKAANWGMLDGKPVCHDYGISVTSPRGGLRKATWD